MLSINLFHSDKQNRAITSFRNEIFSANYFLLF